jgi:hypothetical protein
MATRSYIVGDSFVRFAQHDNVMTVDQLRQALATQRIDLAAIQLMPGLGLAAGDFDVLQHALRAAGATPETVARFERAQPALALTHKRDEAHVMIGAIQPQGGAEYRAEMVVNGLEDRLADHVTGQHVGGMLLVEAARQLGIAVVELEYGEAGQKRWGLAWSSLRVRFAAFVFPLPAVLHARGSEDQNRVRPNQRAITVTVTVEQAGQPVCEIELDVTLIDSALLATMEQKAAARALSRVELARPEVAGSFSHAS